MIDHRRVFASLPARPRSARVPADRDQMISLDTREGFADAERPMASRSPGRES
jgi:hypothetical protein